jgi:integrase
VPILSLTERTIANAKTPSNGQHTLWDTTLKHFGLRISQGGSKTFVVMHGPRRDRITIGHYPTISLAQAREKAKEVLAERTLNKTRAPRIAFDEARTLFFEVHRQRNKQSTIDEYHRIFERHLAPRLKCFRLSDITPHDIQRILDRLASTPSECNHCYAVARCFFTFCFKRRYIERSPMDGMEKPTKYRPRTRVLSNDELARVWKAAETYGYPFGPIVQLLILTGQRRSEIGKLKWSYITDRITLPAEIVKNNREHSIPLSPMAAGILKEIPHLSEYVFVARGSTSHFNGWQSCTFTLLKAAGTAHWTLHDLRRTFATRLAEFGVPPHVIERLLNHVDGTLSPIALVYNRASYLKEMGEALALWERHLKAIVAGSAKKAA